MKRHLKRWLTNSWELNLGMGFGYLAGALFCVVLDDPVLAVVWGGFYLTAHAVGVRLWVRADEEGNR